MLTANQCSGSRSVGYWASLTDPDQSFGTDPDPSINKQKKITRCLPCDFWDFVSAKNDKCTGTFKSKSETLHKPDP
jgi:hypothetical protein